MNFLQKKLIKWSIKKKLICFAHFTGEFYYEALSLKSLFYKDRQFDYIFDYAPVCGADVLIVAGNVTYAQKNVIKEVYNEMDSPKWSIYFKDTVNDNNNFHVKDLGKEIKFTKVIEGKPCVKEMKICIQNLKKEILQELS